MTQQHQTMSGFRLSPQQERLWLLGPEARTAAAWCALRIDGPLDVQALERALQRLIARHEILRTTFRRLPGMSMPVQVVDEEMTVTLQRLDLGVRRAETFERLSLDASREPLDPEVGPVLRVALGTLDEDSHALLLTLPSLCADNISFRNAVGELARLYADEVAGGEVADVEGGVLQYADYAEFQYELCEGPEADEGHAYWRGRVEHATTFFPHLRMRDAAHKVGTVEVELAQTAVAGLRQLATSKGTGMPLVWLACWQTLLHLLSGQEHVVVGRVCDGRVDEALTDALGRFCRRVPALCSFAPGLTFEGVLSRIIESARSDELWQDFFDGTVLGRDGATLLIAFEAEPMMCIPICGDATFNVLSMSGDGEPFDLKLRYVETTDVPRVELLFDARRFPHAEAVRLARRLASLIEQVALAPRAFVADIELLSETERHQSLIEWSDTRYDFADGFTIDGLIEARAAERPEALAVLCDDEQLTYGALVHLARGLARRLRAQGVVPETRVGLCLERSAAFVIAMLGVLKAGGVCVPLDPSYPKDRLSLILEDAGASLLLTESSLRGLLPETARVVCLDDEWPSVTASEPGRVACTTVGDNLVYVVYTSGSTGRPKGVGVRHESLCNYVGALGTRLELDSGDVYLHTASISFSASARQLFVPLALGACVIIAMTAERKDPHALAALFKRHGVTVWDTVPSFLAVSAEVLMRQGESPRYLPRSILVTGEVLPWEVAAKWLNRSQSAGIRVVNLYGQSETTGTVILQPLNSPPTEGMAASVPVGRPLANTRAFLLDARLRAVPVGGVGELYLSGASLARGYLDAALTAERFIPDPFVGEPGARLYKSGDLMTHLTDGRLDFVSRGDDQVQVRGMRVQLKEIEAALGRHEGVRQAVVVACDGDGGVRSLAAYVVPRPEFAPGIGALRESLREQLPDYMIPADFVLLDALPVTPTGKVDRLALPTPDHSRRTSSDTFVAPRTPLEGVIAEVWAEVLKLEEVGVSDNFFDLGGHSMLVTQVLARLRDLLGVELSLQLFFESPTVAQLSETILRHADQPESVKKTAELLITVSELSEASTLEMLAPGPNAGSGNINP